jgi:hypothetical protein
MPTLKTHNYTTYARKAIEFLFSFFIISMYRVLGLITYLDEIPII